MAKRRAQRRGFGRIRPLPSGRHQAGYVGPDDVLHNAPYTFETRMDAEEWLAAERRILTSGNWVSPADRQLGVGKPITLAGYVGPWLATRDWKPSTRYRNQPIIDGLILPALGDRPLTAITPPVIRGWYARLDPSTPNQRQKAYVLLKAILATAVEEDNLIKDNPCRVAGAAAHKSARKIRPATMPELEVLLANMPERYRVMVLLSAWCALRHGEVAELRRSDLDLKEGRIRIRRGVTHVPGVRVVGTPKTDASTRDVAIPPHLLPIVKAHVAEHAQFGRDGLLFPDNSGRQLHYGSTYWHFDKARKAAGRPDLRFHDLRHTGAVLAAQSGATLAELMARLGHTTVDMAMRYQHAAEDSDMRIARRLSDLAGG
jgi:integrase